MYIIAGLGNPDRKYAGTRHNIGFDVITYLSDKYDISLSKTGFKSKLGQGFIDGEKVLLMKPQTYMNLSGEAVGEAVNFYKADAASELIIVQDDIDLEPGNIRIRSKGSAGGHNGGKPEGRDLADHVLSGFDRDTEPLIRKVIEKAGEAIVTVMKEGAEAAMNKYNGMKIEV